MKISKKFYEFMQDMIAYDDDKDRPFDINEFNDTIDDESITGENKSQFELDWFQLFDQLPIEIDDTITNSHEFDEESKIVVESQVKKYHKDLVYVIDYDDHTIRLLTNGLLWSMVQTLINESIVTVQ